MLTQTHAEGVGEQSIQNGNVKCAEPTSRPDSDVRDNNGRVVHCELHCERPESDPDSNIGHNVKCTKVEKGGERWGCRKECC